MALATSSYHEFSNPTSEVEVPFGVLRCERLIIVIVSRKHKGRSGQVQILPKRQVRAMAPLQSRRKTGVMPIGDSTLACVVLKVTLEPAFLRRAKNATAHMRAVGIEGNQVPRS